MRDIQRRSKQREEEKQEPVKVMWKSEKYANVESKIKQDVQVLLIFQIWPPEHFHIKNKGDSFKCALSKIRISFFYRKDR